MVYVSSDLHGYPLLSFLDLLHKAEFSRKDFLFVLGDVIDRNGDGGIALLRWMMQQPNMELLLGNHENMLLDCAFIFEEITEHSLDNLTPDQMDALMLWLMNGAEPTMKALKRLHAESPEELRDLLDFLREAPLYETVSLEDRDFLLVHSGLKDFQPDKPLRSYGKKELLWHRPAKDERYFENITTVIGHTPTVYFGRNDGRAFHTDTWIDIDTGAGAGGAPMLLRLDDMREFYAD